MLFAIGGLDLAHHKKMSAKPTRAKKTLGTEAFKATMCEEAVTTKTADAVMRQRLGFHRKICLQTGKQQVTLAHCLLVVTGTTTEVLLKGLGCSGKHLSRSIEAGRQLQQSHVLSAITHVDEFAGLHCCQRCWRPGRSRCNGHFLTATLWCNPKYRPHVSYVSYVSDAFYCQPPHAPPRLLQWHTWLQLDCATRATLWHLSHHETV